MPSSLLETGIQVLQHRRYLTQEQHRFSRLVCGGRVVREKQHGIEQVLILLVGNLTGYAR